MRNDKKILQHLAESLRVKGGDMSEKASSPNRIVNVWGCSFIPITKPILVDPASILSAVQLILIALFNDYYIHAIRA